jgi:hypothetical protein
MKAIGSFVAAIVLFSSPLALAHGGGKHVMGTLKSVEDKALTVQTKDRKEVNVAVDQDTRFDKAGVPATIKDLAPGERVVVHTAKPTRPGELKAVLVKFGASPGGTPPHETHEHHGEGTPAKK